MNKKPASSEKAASPPSLGFDVIEGMLHEYRDTGKSPSLNRLMSFSDKGLDKYLSENPSPPAQKDAALAKEALNLAKELVLDNVELAKASKGK